MNCRSAGVLGTAFFAACAVAPSDPFARAEAALRGGDLLTALRVFESVPASDARREAALASAFAIESRLRRGYAALYEGIVHRGNGDDGAALACLQRARLECPQLPLVDAWIAATRARVTLTPATPVPTVAMEPDEPVAGESGAAPEDVADGRDAGVDGATNVASTGASTQVRGATPGADDTIAPGLVAVEARLAAGELELAVIDLLELARRHPNDPRVGNRLARVLHQRALLRYGEGSLVAAIADWQQVLALQPENRAVKLLLEAARTESASPSR